MSCQSETGVNVESAIWIISCKSTDSKRHSCDIWSVERYYGYGNSNCKE